MHRDLWIYLLIAGLALGAYAPLRHNAFVDFDDQAHVVADAVVGAPLGLSTLEGALELSRDGVYWQPITVVSLAVTHAVFGFDPVAFHLENLAWHVASALLVFLGLRAATGARGRSALVALLFAVHPLNVESVAWAVERKNVLAAFFGLLAVGLYLRFARTRSRWAYAAMLAAAAVSLAAKPILLPLPALLLALDVWPLQRRWTWALLLEKIPVALLSVGVAAVIMAALRGLPRGELPALALRLGNAALVPWRQILHVAWPLELAVFYPYPLALPLWLPIAAAVGLAGVTVAVVRLRARAPYALAGWMWFLAALVPTLGITQAGQWAAVADRHAYVAVLGLLVAVVWGGAELARRVPARLQLVVGAAAVAACAVLTTLQVETWRDTVTLFARARETQGADPSICFGLGKGLLDAGDGRGEAYLLEAVGLAPGHAGAHNELGRWCFRSSRHEEAVGHFSRALMADPMHAAARGDLGGALNQLGRFHETIAVLRASALLPEGRFNLGVAYVATGQRDCAMREAEALSADAPELAAGLARYVVSVGL